MTVGYIRYRSDYKHQLASEYKIKISIRPKQVITTDFIDLDTEGNLLIKNAYAWDGQSGPVKYTPKNLRASLLVHDALYQLMRRDKLKSRTHRKAADLKFNRICKEDGVPKHWASIWYRGLRKFGKPATNPENKRRVHRAPRGA